MYTFYPGAWEKFSWRHTHTHTHVNAEMSLTYLLSVSESDVSMLFQAIKPHDISKIGSAFYYAAYTDVM